MILAPMCSLNDLGPGFTLEAEPTNRRYVKFFSPNGYFALQILGLGKKEFSKKGLYFTYTL
jgi:hypothetical protein